MSESQNKLPCEIVQDLLPLYHDGVVNSVTQQAVSEHLETCESCATEYRLLSAQLPVEPEEPATKHKFADLMKNLKKKRIVTAVISVILACALLAGGFYVLTEIPLVPIPASEMPVLMAYRYEMDGNEYFFVLYQHPFYTAPTSGKFITEQEENGGDQTFIVKWRKPMICGTLNIGLHNQILTTSFTGGPYDTLKFGDTVIWSEAENGDDPVPDYVYAFAEVVKEEGGVSYDLDFEKDLFRIYSEGGERIREWDLEGNLLYDSAEETP